MNNEKLLELANELIGDVVNQKITGVSVDNTNYEDGSKRLSIDIDYVETSGFKAKIDGESFKTVVIDEIQN
ncbi:hypothetical protein LMG8526HA_02000 [Lactococcus lactis]|jgi:hypothetical protein|uniref:hypothetical protein n=1 Tax=Lactococcus lactis TaxID=1358 RepID=UPI00071D4910|nr:hypothetical protein [Lactococcus lactis]KSU10828.1 Phage protein [Lactococcus lactis subsp. lactis]MDR2059481.1 hypothetical protein [Lactococcus lactis]MDU0401114.1 hypothetical protein [Lactococcus lactis]